MSSEPPAIVVENVAKSFVIASAADRARTTLAESFLRKLRRPFARPPKETFWAVDGISFEIAQGDVVGIIGRNGAGKSTLLKILSRILVPTRGSVELRGRVGSLLEVGTGFHPELTGRENVFLNGAILGMTRSEIRARFDEIVAFAEVDQFLDTPVKRYSSGMYVRLAFAVAAHLNPEILIVDEVLAVGDGAFQRKCLGKMKDVSDSQGRTVLFVSHNMSAIRKLCRRALYLEKGRCTVCATVDDAIALYDGDPDDDPQEADVSGLARSDFGGLQPFGTKARILRVGWAGEPPRYGRPLEIRMLVRVDRPLEEAHANITFQGTDGTPALTLDSLNQGATYRLDPGLHEIALAIPWNPLHPGRYSGNVAVSSGGELLDHVYHAVRWAVAAPEQEWFGEFGNGGARVPVEFSVREVVGP